MKILFIIPILGGGGAEILLGNIAEHLNRLNHEVKIICLHNHHETYRNFPNLDYIANHIRPIIVNCNIQFSFIKKNKIDNSEYLKVINEFNPEIIHSHLFESELLSYSEIRPNTRYFSHSHDNMPQLKKFSIDVLFSKKKLANFYESIWLKSKYNQADARFISISKDCSQYLKVNLPKRLHGNISLLPNAINLNRFYTSKKDKSCFTIISIGNLVEKKGHKLLLDTVKLLVDLNINIKLKILGYGNLQDSLIQYSKNLDINEYVEFLGNVSDVEGYLAKADIYVHTASYEPFGLALIEAMASSLPVICTDGGGNRDLIEDGGNGFMIDKRDPKLIADKIVLLLNNEELRLKIGYYAQQFSKQYDIKVYVNKLLVLYKDSMSSTN